jgi:hypothetical protein
MVVIYVQLVIDQLVSSHNITANVSGLGEVAIIRNLKLTTTLDRANAKPLLAVCKNYDYESNTNVFRDAYKVSTN